MRKKYGIGFYLVLFVGVCLLEIGYRWSSHLADNRVKMQAAQREIAENARSTEADGTAEKNTGYYLKELHGYVVVYLSDQKTIYQYTDILIQELPEHLASEIQNAKYIDSTEELYGFLENYSS